ncbi:hypothetical protein [Sphingobium ummariense]|uniref:Uncharacterized protein n=1 Tax=Sphingobium ummariense RL-3 TaxID=1346791 RepID=T0J252_9SPHN|nr:hypothetical protein [Sphingobium ummariense]EQB32036.1 hypothetical protein M529_11875 [Sphingobium ummariense RL-3]
MRFFKSHATTMDRATVVSNNWRLIIGRMTLSLEIRTNEAVAMDRRLATWDALRAQAVAASDPETVEWALDDLWAAGGTDITARALLRRIIDGSYRSPW